MCVSLSSITMTGGVEHKPQVLPKVGDWNGIGVGGTLASYLHLLPPYPPISVSSHLHTHTL